MLMQNVAVLVQRVRERDVAFGITPEEPSSSAEEKDETPKAKQRRHSKHHHRCESSMSDLRAASAAAQFARLQLYGVVSRSGHDYVALLLRACVRRWPTSFRLNKPVSSLQPQRQAARQPLSGPAIGRQSGTV